MAGRITFRRRFRPSVLGDLVPMIDIIFQLVVFFMVTSTMSQLPGIEIELPESSTSQVVTIENIVLTIGSEDQIYYNDEEKSLEEVEALLQGIPQEERKGQSIVIRGDQDSSLGQFVSLLDLLRKNGFENYAVPVTVTQMEK